MLCDLYVNGQLSVKRVEWEIAQQLIHEFEGITVIFCKSIKIQGIDYEE